VSTPEARASRCRIRCGVSQWSMARARTPLSGWGVRKSSVLIAVAAVFLALLGGGALLVLALQSALTATATDAAAGRAGEIVILATDSGLAEADSAVTGDSRPTQLLQILAPDGQVLAASRPRLEDRPLARVSPAAGSTVTVHSEIHDVGSTDDFVVVAQGFSVDAQTYVVQVAAPLGVEAETVRTVALFLLGATPVLLVVVAVATWVLVGRALGPVETIQEQVSRIDGHRLADRVAVPASNDEIAALASTMNVMLDRLEASDRAQRSFVSDASHELRSPLSAVITAAEVSAADPSGALWEQRLETVLVESNRMRFLVDNLMTLAKADSHDLDLRAEDVDLDDLVETEAGQLRSRSAHRIASGVSPVRVTGDPRRLAQVVRNLLENADRHARTTIEVSLSAGPGAAVLWVDNDGEVIEESMRQRVFERFVRLDDSRSRDHGGSGLGLAISAEIVHAHGGTISAAESPSGWCRFEVVLPLRDEAPTGTLRLGSG
jgi:signal transduction histidine kinase